LPDCCIFGSSIGLLWIFILLFTTVEATDLFGRKHFAKIPGYMSVFYVWGSVLGPVIAGAIGAIGRLTSRCSGPWSRCFSFPGSNTACSTDRGRSRSLHNNRSTFRDSTFKVSENQSRP
jgi:hypothetical protein